MKLRNYYTILLIAFIVISSVGDFTMEIMASDVSAELFSNVVRTDSSRTKKSKKSKKKNNKKSRGKKNQSKSLRSKRKKGRIIKRNSGRVSTRPVEIASNDSLTLLVNSMVLRQIPSNLNPGGLRVNSVKADTTTKTVAVSLNENFTYLPVTNEFINTIKKTCVSVLPDSISKYEVRLKVGGKLLSYYITKVDRLPEKSRKNVPFVVPVDRYQEPTKGMPGDIIALWHSHGRYFKPGSSAWMWQRPFLFETVEDVFTMGFVLPYLVPMLENAGAYVMLPRERDTNVHEVIVDGDTNDGGLLFSQSYYREQVGIQPWRIGEGEGFIYDLPDFRDTENPFQGGTYRQTTTITSGKQSVAAWYADIPETGDYAVYVSYKSLPNSTTDALYTINYSGGHRQFKINQTMGGGTWIYLGTFPLESGYSENVPIVTLTNLSSHQGAVVTADAVKIGGGMGNIARSNRRSDIYYDPSTPESENLTDESSTDDDGDDDESDDSDSDEQSDDDFDVSDINDNVTTNLVDTTTIVSTKRTAPDFYTSKYPRFLEGARYWLHWAGMPENIYSPYHGTNDYKDDYTSRAMWVNYLAGGSRVLPDEEGLGIPVDLAFALHSDAGKRADDSIVGTLGIYYTDGGETYADGTARINSRMLTDMLMRQITSDVRQTLEPEWTRRSMWDKSYVEARIPEVPTALIELLSHQNFADMQCGLDPNFRFIVGRAIYKAMARFMSERKAREVVIQPLPVHGFSIKRVSKGKYRLSWKPTKDPLESTAMPDKYIVFERKQNVKGFHKIAETKKPELDVEVKDSEIHSFKIVAANAGGLSFDSEILALREDESHSEPILIINGFTRVSAPGHFSENGSAGFDADNDFGVPYLRDISFTGYQTEFRRNAGESFGRSGSNYATKIIAGNSFDFVFEHGKAITAAGYGFVSTSVDAVESGGCQLKQFKSIDLILGKQKTTYPCRGKTDARYKTITPELMKHLKEYLNRGGDLFVSGQYVASDMLSDSTAVNDINFMENMLGCRLGEKQKIHTPRVEVINTDLRTGISAFKYIYNNTLSEKQYIVETPDILMPNVEKGAQTLMRFAETDYPAAVVMKNGRAKTIVMSIPFESLKEENARNKLMREILNFFNN